MGRWPGIAGQRRPVRPEGPAERQRVLSRATAPSAEGEECGPLGWAPPWPRKPLTAPLLPTGMFCLLSRQVCTPDLQQSLHIPHLGHRAGLVPGPVLHGVRPPGHGGPPRPDRRALPRGKYPGPRAGGRMLKASQLAVGCVTWGPALALSEPQAPPSPCGAAEAAGRRLRCGKTGQRRHLWGPGSGPGAGASDAKTRATARPPEQRRPGCCRNRSWGGGVSPAHTGVPLPRPVAPIAAGPSERGHLLTNQKLWLQGLCPRGSPPPPSPPGVLPPSSPKFLQQSWRLQALALSKKSFS